MSVVVQEPPAVPAVVQAAHGAGRLRKVIRMFLKALRVAAEFTYELLLAGHHGPRKPFI